MSQDQELQVPSEMLDAHAQKVQGVVDQLNVALGAASQGFPAGKFGPIGVAAEVHAEMLREHIRSSLEALAGRVSESAESLKSGLNDYRNVDAAAGAQSAKIQGEQ